MNNFTYYNDEWNPPIVEGTSQPPLDSQLPSSNPNNLNKNQKCLKEKILPKKRGGYV